MSTNAWAYLYYPATLANRPPKARGRVRVRLTPTQAIADRATFEQTDGVGRVLFGSPSVRFRRSTGAPIGDAYTGWRMDRLEHD